MERGVTSPGSFNRLVVHDLGVEWTMRGEGRERRIFWSPHPLLPFDHRTPPKISFYPQPSVVVKKTNKQINKQTKQGSYLPGAVMVILITSSGNSPGATDTFLTSPSISRSFMVSRSFASNVTGSERTPLLGKIIETLRYPFLETTYPPFRPLDGFTLISRPTLLWRSIVMYRSSGPRGPPCNKKRKET